MGGFPENNQTRPEGKGGWGEREACAEAMLHAPGLKSGQCGRREEDEKDWGAGGQGWLDHTRCMTEGGREFHRIHCMSDFSFLCLSPFFLCFPLLFSTVLPLSPTFSFVSPPAFFLIHSSHRKIKTNYFIVSLAFADLLVSVLVMPFGAIELVQDIWIYGEMFCLVRTSLDVLLTTASIFHLCCISLDR